MNIRESLRLAVSSLNTNKLRSLLTLLGIIIGIMAVIIIMTLGRALENDVMGGLEEAGTTTYPVYIHEVPEESDDVDPEDPFGAFTMAPPTNERDAMTLDELQELDRFFGERVTGVDLEYSLEGEAKVGDKTTSTGINPVLAGSLDMRGLEVEYGRGITQDMIDGARPVAVASPSLVEALFDGDAVSALGERVDVDADGQTGVFTIVGVAQEADQNPMFGQMSYADIYIPATAADRVGADVSWTASFSVRSAPTEDPEVFRADLQEYLDRQYRGNDAYTAEVFDIAASLEELTAIFRTMSVVLSAIGGISLLVGGIGVMNIMLITVTERTREIGVRKALGATQNDIRMQFIIEAMMVCLIGGIIGVVLGGAIGMIASSALLSLTWPPLSAVLFSLLFSLAIGVFFGAYPASKAAKMQPIDALRYE
ncbi:ABC transporter permease [Corynebacterium sp. BCW_4722]|nr:ABC transporter permease [Corynebacterium sp. BCW_4722]